MGKADVPQGNWCIRGDGWTSCAAERTDGSDGPPGLRCIPTTESAAYLAVVEAAQRAAADGAQRLDVGLRNDDGVLRMDMTSDAGSHDVDWERVADRVGAAGGRMSISADVGGPRLHLELPCV